MNNIIIKGLEMNIRNEIIRRLLRQDKIMNKSWDLNQKGRKEREIYYYIILSFWKFVVKFVFIIIIIREGVLSLKLIFLFLF